MRTWMVLGLGASLCLGVACGSSGDVHDGGGGEGGEPHGGDGTPPEGGSVGEGGAAAAPNGGAGEGGAAGGGGGADDCANAETLPRSIEEDLEVGPGCVRIERTQVTGGATLTIAPGTTVQMAAAGFLLIEDSALVSIGTAADPIVFTSEEEAPLAGDWQCVHVDNGSAATNIEYTTFEYGGSACSATGAGYEGMLTLFGPARAVSNNTFRHSSTHAVRIGSGGSVRSFENNAFADNERPSIRVAAPELLALGEGLTFADEDDVIEIDTQFALGTTGTWLRQPVPFLVVGQLDIHDRAEVTIAAGTTLLFNGQSFEVFNANLIVAGTEDEPVVFTSAQNTPAAGDWGCLLFSSVTGTPRIEYAHFEYAGNGAGCSGANQETALSVPATAVVENSTFRSIAGSAIKSGTCNTAEWCTNTFEAVETGPLACGSGGTPTECP